MDVVEPAHPWECTPPPIPRDTDVSECLQPLPDWCSRMWYWLRRGPLVRWGLEVGRCVVHLPGQSTKVDCWTCCLPYQCCQLNTRMQCVPSHMVGSFVAGILCRNPASHSPGVSVPPESATWHMPTCHGCVGLWSARRHMPGSSASTWGVP